VDYFKVFGGYQKDVDAFVELANVVRRRRALALVGAGVSVRVNFPSWPELMQALATHYTEQAARNKRAPDQRPRDRNDALLPSDFRDDLLWQGEVLRTRLDGIDPKAYMKILKRIFKKPANPDSCALLLARLPFRHFLTTNYERVMFTALSKAREAEPRVVDWTVDEDALRMMHTFLEAEAPPHLVHLHGRIERPEGIVLTDRDYARHYLRSDSAMRKLFALFALNRFVFFGFSLTDPDLMALLRQVAGGLAFENRPRHFVILAAGKGYPRDDVRERLIQKFGVRPVFYENGEGDHASFEPLMGELVRLAASDEEQQHVSLALSGSGQPVKPGRTGQSKSAISKRVNRDHPDDPRKGMFGRRDEDNGLRLSAEVTRSEEQQDWFDIVLKVESTTAQALTGQVRFYLHNTFLKPTRTVTAKDGVARLELSAYGAFTVGALPSSHRAELELDLASLSDAPKAFREN